MLPPTINASTIVEGNAIVILGPIQVSQRAQYGQSAKYTIIQMAEIDKHNKLVEKCKRSLAI